MKENKKNTISQISAGVLSQLVSKGISLLNNRKLSSFQREEFRTIEFSWSQYGEDILVYNLLRSKDPLSGFFVDAGAYHPFHFSTTNLLYRKGWRGLNIDLEERKLNLFRKARPEDKCIQAALSDCEEEVIHLQYEAGALDKIVSQEIADKSSYGYLPHKETPFKTVKLNDILSEFAPRNKRFDYLNIDCEGNDLRVLKGLDLTKFSPYIITIEANKEESKQEIYDFLSSWGYRFCCSLGVTQVFAGQS
jgi:FkbM family methyltransferase